MNREEIVSLLSKKYYEFLISLPYEDALFMKGIHEGKGKFLANLHIYLTTKNLPKKWNDKRYGTDYVTLGALEILQSNNVKELEYEHIIPKKKYIQDVCEERAKEGTLTEEYVNEILMKYLWTATVTKEEHAMLSRRNMPIEWDEEDIFSRYSFANIKLIKHKKEYITLE